MTLWQFALSFWLGGAVSYSFGTAIGLKLNGTLREHPVASVFGMVVMGLVWPIMSIHSLSRTVEERKL